MEAIQVQEEALTLATEIRRTILQFRREEDARRAAFEARVRALEERQELLESKVAGGFVLLVEHHNRPHLIKVTGTATSLEEAKVRAVGDCESPNHILSVMACRDWKVMKARAYAALSPTRTCGWVQIDAARVEAILTAGLDEGRSHLAWIRIPSAREDSDSDSEEEAQPGAAKSDSNEESEGSEE